MIKKHEPRFLTSILLWLLLGGGLAAAKTPIPADPFAVSTDQARYGDRIGGQQIPAIARVGTRWFCLWYGNNKGERGSGGEGYSGL